MKRILLVTTFLLALAITLTVGVRTYQTQHLTLPLNRIVDVGVSAETQIPAITRSIPAPSPSMLVVAANVVERMQTPMLYVSAIALFGGLSALAFVAWDNQRYVLPVSVEAQSNGA